MTARFLASMSDPPIEVALVEFEELEDESENQLDLFLPLEPLDEAIEDGVADPLEDASLCRCCSRIWSSPMVR